MPVALRPEHYNTIRSRLDRIEWHQAAIEDAVFRAHAEKVKKECPVSRALAAVPIDLSAGLARA